MSISVFAANEYSLYIRTQIDGAQNRGLVTRMAEAAKCQRSHISRVVSGQLHLTPEQAFRLTRFFNLNSNETNYFMKLVEFDRSGDPEYRASLKQELVSLKQAHEDLANRIAEPTIGSLDREMLYYSSWYWSALHIIVSIPRFQNTRAIADRLNLSQPMVELCLKRLEGLGLIRQEGKGWKIAGGGMHLAKESPLNSIQHSNWRARAVMATQNPEEDGVHYTVVQSLSYADFERVKQLLIKTIDSYAKIARPSQEEELICFTCDFFKV